MINIIVGIGLGLMFGVVIGVFFESYLLSKELKYERNFYKDKLYRFSIDTWEWVENNCSDIQIESYLLRRHLKNRKINK